MNCLRLYVFGVGGHIVHMDNACFEHHSPDDATAGHRQWIIPLRQKLSIFGRRAEARRSPVPLAITAEEVSEFGFAQPHGGFHDSIEHRLQVEG